MSALLWTPVIGIGPTWATETLVRDADEFHKNVATVKPGDVIVMANGDWRNVELIAEANGSPTAPISIRAEQPGKVTLTGNSRLRISGTHVVVEGLRFCDAWHKTALVEFRRDSKSSAKHCRLTNCEIIDCNPEDLKLGFKYVSIYGRQNTIDRCRFQGKRNPGATMVAWLSADAGQHTIRRNHFGPRPNLGENGGETIRIGDSKTAHLSGKTIVEENLFEECNGESEIISNKSCDNLYRGNVFLRCSGALTLRHGHRCRVAQNRFLGQKARGSGGVRIIGRDHTVINNYFERLEGSDYRSALCLMNGIPDSPDDGYDPVLNALVAHNTFVDCKRTILLGADNEASTQVPPQDCLLANNVIVTRRGPMIDVRSNSIKMQWLGNRVFGEGDLGIDPQGGLRRVDLPPLTARDDGRWTLSQSSPLVNAGDTFPAMPRVDISGEPRDSSPDVGCDEWPLQDPSPPSTEIRVGPSWSTVRRTL